MRTDFRNSFGDATVNVPDHFRRPCQWLKGTHDEETFMRYWRGWIKEGGEDWEFVAPEGFEEVEAIAPLDENCEWSGKDDALPSGP